MMVTKFGGKQWDPASMAVAKVARNHMVEALGNYWLHEIKLHDEKMMRCVSLGSA